MSDWVAEAHLLVEYNMITGGVPRDVYFEHDFKAGDVAYLLVNPDIVPKGYVKLLIEYENDRETLVAHEICEDAGRQAYQVNKWCRDFLTEEPKRADK